MKKISYKGKEVNIYNYTPHTLDFVQNAHPYSLTERKVDFSVESDGVLTAKTVTKEEKQNNIVIMEMNFEVAEEDIKKIQEIIRDISDNEMAIIYVSKIFLDALKAANFPVKGENYVIGMPVTATKREIKPPVAIAFAVGM